jgi:hypothetical protein
MKRVTNFDMLYSPMASGVGLEPELLAEPLKTSALCLTILNGQ